MKVAAQTVIWGNHIRDMERSLRLLAMHGCLGVEFSQRPDNLCSAKVLHRLLKNSGLSLVGLSGGTLKERIEYCDDVLRPEYLYVEDWDENEGDFAIKEGFTLALHPHLFKPCHRLQDASDLLRKYPALKFLPDAAHLSICGDSVAQAVGEWADRLAAVHLKDWSPIYGRTSHRYARGFVHLGKGLVNFDSLFERLNRINYNGWLVFEQGDPEATPEAIVKHATKWLAKQLGPKIHLNRVPLPPIAPTSASRRSPLISEEKPPSYSQKEECVFLEKIFGAATCDIGDYYAVLTEALGRLLHARLILLCACNPTADMMSILGTFPKDAPLPKTFMHYKDSLSSVAVDRQAVTHFALNEPLPAEKYGKLRAQFGYPTLIENLDLRHLISIPVLNPKNPHQVRFVVNFFPQPTQCTPSDECLSRLGGLLAQAADAALDERSALAAATASVRAGEAQQSAAFLKGLQELVLEKLRCRAATIFLLNDSGLQLEPATTTGITWNTPLTEEFYRSNDGIPGRVWERREAILLPDPTPASSTEKSFETAASSGNPSYLCAPIVDMKGSVVGVIRCQSKHGPADTHSIFSEDDLAVLDAIFQSAVPHLQVLLSKERRAKALRRLSHELDNPLVAMRGATERMKKELLRKYGVSETFFTEDYLGDIESLTGLMQGLLANADFYRLADQRIILEQRSTKVYGDVIIPAIGQIKELLLDRNFSRNRISISGIESVPPLWLDKNRLRQVIFNLLSNAIKYADEDPEKFRIVIRAVAQDDCVAIQFNDYGPGVSPEMREAIFLEGVRSKHAEQRHVAGDGLGLWVTRRFVEAHHGTITLTNCANPTQFTILLPQWLRYRKHATHLSYAAPESAIH